MAGQIPNNLDVDYVEPVDLPALTNIPADLEVIARSVTDGGPGQVARVPASLLGAVVVPTSVPAGGTVVAEQGGLYVPDADSTAILDISGTTLVRVVAPAGLSTDPLTQFGLEVGTDTFAGGQALFAPGEIHTLFRVDGGTEWTVQVDGASGVAGATTAVEEIGQGSTLPADDSTFKLFELEGNAVLPDGLYRYDNGSGEWVQD